MDEYTGKYISIMPDLHRGSLLTRTKFLIVLSETKKQVKVQESPDSITINTINKDQIIGIVSAGSVPKKREQARDIQNEYFSKKKTLAIQYLAQMKSIA